MCIAFGQVIARNAAHTRGGRTREVAVLMTTALGRKSAVVRSQAHDPICPLRDVAGELSDSPSWEMGWTPLTVQKDGRTRYYSGDIARIVGAVPDLAVGRP